MQRSQLIQLETLLRELQADRAVMAGLSLIEQSALSSSVEIVHFLQGPQPYTRLKNIPLEGETDQNE